MPDADHDERTGSARRRLEAAAGELLERGVHHIHSLSWRDLDDEDAGGSEVHHDEVFARWADVGLDIAHRSSSRHGRRLIRRRGYTITQSGGRYSVFPRAVAAELFHRLGPRDAVIEIWNGVPWFAPVWHRGPQVTWLHHVHGPMWDQLFPKPVATVGRLLEMRVAPRLYRRHPVVTLASASRDELVELGFPPGNLVVVPPGVHERFSPDGGVSRSATPLVVAAGRLAPVKRFDALLGAIESARAVVPDLEVEIVGDGQLRDDLDAWIRGHGASHWARLTGRVSDDELVAAYRRAWIVASASLAEGWGMTITEAGACGTPAVATDVVGHRDAVIDGVTGDLVPDAGLGTAIASLVRDSDRLTSYGRAAEARRAELTWDMTAARLAEVLLDDVRRRG